MSKNTEDQGFVDGEEKPLTKEQHLINYLKEYIEVLNSITPLKEHLRELKAQYVDKNWLSKEDLKTGIKAFKLMQEEIDFDNLEKFFKIVKKL